MSLPAAWVDSLFARLMVRYGTAFMRQYEGIDPDVVKSDWGDVLAGFDRASIAYALQFLPAERPPTALQFRDQCRRAPRSTENALPPPDAVPADPARLAAALDRLGALRRQRDGMTAAAYCAQRIRTIAGGRGRMSEAQRHVLAACERIGGEGDGMDAGAFRPVPEHALPRSMRPDRQPELDHATTGSEA